VAGEISSSGRLLDSDITAMAMRWKAVLGGQVLALLTACTSIGASLLVHVGIVAPLFQLLWFYVLVCLLCTGVLIHETLKGKIKLSVWKLAQILLGSVIDSQANLLIMYSFAFTSVTSASVLLQTSTLTAAVLSFVLNGQRFSSAECLGLGLCLLGIVGIVLSDLSEQNWQWEGEAKGDLMAAAGATLFSLDSVYQERLVKRGIAPYELLTFLSLFAAPITALEGLLMEWKEIQRIHTYQQVACLVLLACCYSAFYILMPNYIKAYGATLFNMSLTTNIIYTLLFAVTAYRERVKWLYLAGFIVTLTGLVLYNLVAVRRTAIRTPPLLSRTSSFSSLQ